MQSRTLGANSWERQLRTRYGSGAFVVLLMLGTLSTWASAAEIWTCNAVNQTPNIFAAKVIAVTAPGTFLVQVIDVYKGSVRGVVTVSLEYSVPSPRSLKPNTDYLFYAKYADSALYFDEDYTEPLSSVPPEDLKWMRRMASGARLGSIFGHLQKKVGEKIFEPVMNTKVVFTKDGVRYAFRTDPEGAFRALGIPAGKYTMSANAFGEAITADEDGNKHFRVKNRGCIEIKVKAQSKSVISGRILLPTGLTLKGRTVSAIDHSGATVSTETDEEGRYRLTGLPLGDYVVGLNLQEDAFSPLAPFLPTYFPGISDPGQAKAFLFHIQGGAQFSDVDIFMEKSFETVDVTVRIALASGAPLQYSFLWAQPSSDKEQQRKIVGDNKGIDGVSGESIDDLTYWFRLFRGITYKITGFVKEGDHKLNIDPVTVGPDDYPQEITLAAKTISPSPNDKGFSVSAPIPWVAIKVYWPDGSPAWGATAIAITDDGEISRSVTTNKNGEADVFLPGSTQFTVRAYIDQKTACESRVMLFDQDQQVRWSEDQTPDDAAPWQTFRKDGDFTPLVLNQGECDPRQYGQ